jgi:hypothetical protein
MSQARAHILPLRIMPRVFVQMPKRAAVALHVWPAWIAERISRTLATLSFLPLRGLTVPSNLPALTACRRLSAPEHHSRFLKKLLSFAKSLWFTCALVVGGGPMNAVATSRCTFLVLVSFLFDKFTCMYPALSEVWRNTRPCLHAVLNRFLHQWSRLRTLPRELTSYSPSYPSTDRQISV